MSLCKYVGIPLGNTVRKIIELNSMHVLTFTRFGQIALQCSFSPYVLDNPRYY